ncbi:MAG: c-type cytochrome [Hyphomicrobium sp.]
MRRCTRSLGFFAGLATVLAGSPQAAPGDDTAQAGEAVFKTNCTKCHVSAATVARKLKGETAEEKTTNLAKFLETHQKSDPATRPALTAYLIGLTKAP